MGKDLLAWIDLSRRSIGILLFTAVFMLFLHGWAHKGWDMRIPAGTAINKNLNDSYSVDLSRLAPMEPGWSLAKLDLLLKRHAIRSGGECHAYENGHELDSVGRAGSHMPSGSARKEGRVLHFTASDLSDPRVNGRVYSVELKSALTHDKLLPYALLAMLLAMPAWIMRLVAAKTMAIANHLRSIRLTCAALPFPVRAIMNKLDVFLAAMSLLLVVSWFGLIDSAAYGRMLDYENDRIMVDYYGGASALEAGEYSEHMITPPLAAYRSLLSGGSRDGLYRREILERPSSEYRQGLMNIRKAWLRDDFALSIALVVVFGVCFLHLLQLFVFSQCESPTKKVVLVCLFIALPVFMKTVLSGNPIGLAAMLTSFYILNHGHDSRAVRETAFMALALAAGLKIYPAFFGLLTLYKGRHRETVRLILYGLAAFIIPMSLFNGNMLMNFQRFFQALWRDSQMSVPTFNWRILAMRGGYLADFNPGSFLNDETASQLDALLKMLNGAMMIAALATNYFHSIEWKRLLQISMCCLIIVPRCYGYQAIFLLTPLVALLNSKGNAKLDWLILFLMILVLNPWRAYYGGILNGVFLRAMASQAILLILTVESIRGFISRLAPDCALSPV